MKKFKRTAAFIMALSMIISTVVSVPTQAAQKNYWWAYSKCEEYNYVDGKWEKESTDTNSYDKKGRITASSYNSKYSKYKYKYSYNSNGSTTTSYENGKKTGKTVYTYNKNKKTTSTAKEYDAKDKLVSTTKYTYDSKGNCTKRETTYKQKGRKKDVSTTKYTYKGKVIVKSVYKTSDGSKWVDEYSSKGIIKKSTYTNSNSDYKNIYYYNSKGYATKSEAHDSYSDTVTTYTNDKKGNTTKAVEVMTIKDSQEKITTTYTYEYKYDKNGNMLQRLNYSNGEPTSKSVYSGYKKFKITSSK